MFAGFITLLLIGGALATICLVAIAIASKRPGLAVAIDSLFFLGLLFVGGVSYFFVSLPMAHSWDHQQAWTGDAFHGAPPFVSEARHVTWRFSFFGLALLSAAVLFLIVSLLRWATRPRTEGAHGGNWWPALLLLPVLLVLFMVGSLRVQRSHSFSTRHEAERHAQVVHEQIGRQHARIARQQAQMTMQAAKVHDELKHRIDTMEIHELMDLVDAPRIMLPMPAPATFALLASNQAAAESPPAPTAPSPPPKAPQPGEPAEESAADDDAKERRSSGEAENIPDEADGDVQLAAEADAGVAVAEAEAGSTDHAEAEVESAPVAETTALRSPPVQPPAEIAPVDREEHSTEPAPVWIREKPKRVGNVRREVVATEEYATDDECYWAADILLQVKTYEHIRRLIGEPYDTSQDFDYLKGLMEKSFFNERIMRIFRELEIADVKVDYIRREIAKDEYLEMVERSFGPMMKLHTLVEFSPAVDRELRERWEAGKRRGRFAAVGLGAGTVIGLLGMVWGLLKADTWTKGYYTKRLFIGVPLALLGAFGLYTMLLEMGFDLPH